MLMMQPAGLPAAPGSHPAGLPQLVFQPAEMSPLHELLRVLNRHRVLVLAMTMLGLGLAILACALLPARYTATAAVSLTGAAPDPLQPNAAAQSLGDDDTATQAALMTGRDIAGQVVSAIGYGLQPARPGAAPPSLAARVDQFVGHLTAQPEDHARLINLTFKDHDPVMAATALNTLVQVFQQDQIAGRTAALDRTSGWLSQRADALHAKWTEANARAGAFRARYGLTIGGAGGADMPVATQETMHVAADYAAAQATLASAQARQAAMHARGAAATDDPVEGALVAQLSMATAQQAQMRAAHGANYPEVDAIGRQVAAAAGQLGAARGRALASADTDVAAARAAVATLGDNLKSLQGQTGSLGARAVELAGLENEAHGAQVVYEEFLARTTELQERAALLQPSVQFASHAAVPGLPSFPNKPRIALAGLVAGLLSGAALVIAREHLARGFSNVSRIGRELATPLLCSVPLIPGRHDRAAIEDYVTAHPLSQVAEAVRGLATQLHLAGGPAGPVRSLAVTSATGREGKTTMCLWLAATLARGGQRVLLIDADHRRGTIATRLGGSATVPGLAELVTGRAGLAAAIQHAAGGIDFVGCGAPMSHAFGGAELQRLRALTGELAGRYDVVLFDTPPLLAMSDALAYAQVADRTLMLCMWRSTVRQAVVASLERLEAAGAHMLGVVLTMVDAPRMSLFSDELRAADTQLLAGYYSTP